MMMVTVVPEGCPMQAKVTCTSSSAHTRACCSCSRHAVYASPSLSSGGLPAGNSGHSACRSCARGSNNAVQGCPLHGAGDTQGKV